MNDNGKSIISLEFGDFVDICLDVKPPRLVLGRMHYMNFPKNLEALIEESIVSKSCFYCGERLDRADFVQGGGEIAPSYWYDVCNSCGFWRYRDTDTVGSVDRCLIPVAKSFSHSVYTPALSELVSAVSRNPDKIFSMDPSKFEIFVGSVLKDYLNCEVRHVGRTADGGVDLIALLGEAERLIQVKRRADRSSAEGVETVKLIFATSILRGVNAATVITSARRFTRGARAIREDIAMVHREFDMKLVDFDNLMAMIGAATINPIPPYKRKKRYAREELGKIIKIIKIDDGCCVEYEQDSVIEYFLMSNISNGCVDIFKSSSFPKVFGKHEDVLDWLDSNCYERASCEMYIWGASNRIPQSVREALVQYGLETAESPIHYEESNW